MMLKKYRWSSTYEADEQELLRQAQFQKYESERWEAEPAEEFHAHYHSKDKKLWCVDGSIEFWIKGERVVLQAGDALDLPAETVHSALAGMAGCACYESPRLLDNPTIEYEKS